MNADAKCIKATFARVYRQNMRNWALLWRRARHCSNRELATIALRNAVVNNRWAKEVA